MKIEDFKVLTKDEVILVLESIEPQRTDLKEITALEMVQKFKTIGWLIMAKIKDKGKWNRVGIAHKDLNKPLFFENKKDAYLYVKNSKRIIKST